MVPQSLSYHASLTPELKWVLTNLTTISPRLLYSVKRGGSSSLVFIFKENNQRSSVMIQLTFKFKRKMSALSNEIAFLIIVNGWDVQARAFGGF